VGFETEVQGDRAVHQFLSLVLACLPDRNRAGQLLYQEFTVWRAFIKARSGTLGWGSRFKREARPFECSQIGVLTAWLI